MNGVRSAMVTACISSMLFALCGCKNSLGDRSLVFFTGTTVGLEVAVNPSDPTGPGKIIIGYKRGEGVLNPVYHSDGVEVTAAAGALPATTKRYRDQAYSVIAKFSGESSASAASTADGRLSVAQWFATGDAADVLARQPGIAGAVTGSAEIAKEATNAAKVGGDMSGLNRTYMLKFLQNVDSGLRELAAGQAGRPPDAIAQEHRSKLARFVQNSLPPVVLIYSPGQPGVADMEESLDIVTPDLGKLAAVIESLEASNTLLKAQLERASFTFLPMGGRPQVAVPTTAAPPNAEFVRLKDQLSTNQHILKEAKARLSSDPSVLAAIEYYVSVVTGKKGA